MKNGVAVPGNKKQTMEFDGRKYVVEPAIAGDVAFVHAWKADEVGNLVFRYTANNYNAVMARNAKLTIVEVCLVSQLGLVNADLSHLSCQGGGDCVRTRFYISVFLF